VVPCGEYRHPELVVGNVVTDGFKRVWNGERMRHFRRVLWGRKLFPGCDRCCGLASYAR
jgi:MoaA/NifB/PqqE/SkfB family radical SAM enzyme